MCEDMYKYNHMYLLGRPGTQYVSIKGSNTDLEKIKHGVTSGSVLDPTRFLIYNIYNVAYFQHIIKILMI